jgi:hypothetical protein
LKINQSWLFLTFQMEIFMNFKELVGKVIVSVEGLEVGSERIVYHFEDGTACEVVHMHDCCESVAVYRIDPSETIIGLPILEAIEEFDNTNPPENADSWTWTNQLIRTSAGQMTVVWLGESNGYYGETPYCRITHGKIV